MFTVSHNGENVGPLEIEEISRRLASQELAITDFAWDETVNDWVTLMEFAPLRNFLAQKKPSTPLVNTSQRIETVVTKIEPVSATELVQEASVVGTEELPEWFVSRGQQKFGPFTYFGVIKNLQDKIVYEFDYVWKEGMEDWARIAEHPLFCSEAIRKLRDQHAHSAIGQSIFAERKFARYAIENSVLVHDNNSVSPGHMIEAGQGGSGIIIKNSALRTGQVVNIHYSALEGLPAFNAIGEIVSKKFANGVRDRRAPIHYGVRFVKVEPQVSVKIKKYFDNKDPEKISA